MLHCNRELSLNYNILSAKIFYSVKHTKIKIKFQISNRQKNDKEKKGMTFRHRSRQRRGNDRGMTEEWQKEGLTCVLS